MNIRRNMKCWMEKQHLELWHSPYCTQRWARELISGPDPAVGTQLLSFNRAKSRVATGEETSVHILCGCEALASFRHAYLGSFFLGPENIMELGMEAIWNFAKGTGLVQNMEHTGPVIKA
jgi:hypothetical protein